MSYFYKGNVEDAKIYTGPKKIIFDKGKYPGDMLRKIHSLTGDSNIYGASLVNSNKWTIRAALIGLVVGSAAALYFKRGVFGGAILGAVGGTLVGLAVSKLQDDKAKKLEESKKQIKT
jgi:hypothetical protein